MKITVVGTGYVGLVQGVCLAELGNDVVCVDIDPEKIAGLKKGVSPIYEPGIEELITKNIEAGRIGFTTDLGSVINAVEIVFIAVGTPSDAQGKADLQFVTKVANEIGQALTRDGLVIVNKSTVPIGTGQLIKETIAKHFTGKFEVVSNPEFLREGTAIEDFMRPDRVIIGVNGNRNAAEKVSKLYNVLERPIMITNLETAEMIKYASNSYLATQISFVNSLARLCEKVDANVKEVAEGMKLDERIGKKAFLSAGLGYGGSCFPKDVRALVSISKECGMEFGILEKVEEVNNEQRQIFIDRISRVLGEIKGKRIAIWGLSFKPKTDDVRDAPSVTIISELVKLGAEIRAYDPVAVDSFRKAVGDKVKIEFASSPYDACDGADALVILTEWSEFHQPDLPKLKKHLKNSIIIDGRNIFDREDMINSGFEYYDIGRHNFDKE